MVTKKSQSSFNWYTKEDILANGSFEESPIPSTEQARPLTTPLAKKDSNSKNDPELAKIDWEIVDDILIDEISNVLPILTFENTRPSLNAFVKRFPIQEETTAIDIVKSYFSYLTRKNIYLSNFQSANETLERVAEVNPMFYIANSVLGDMGITFVLTLDRKKMNINKIAYLGRSEASLLLKQEAIIVLTRIGCKLTNTTNKKMKFTHPKIIHWFNETLSANLLFDKEQIEEAFQTIIQRTEHRMNTEFIYLID